MFTSLTGSCTSPCSIPTGQQLMYFFSFLAAGGVFLLLAFTIFLPVIILAPAKVSQIKRTTLRERERVNPPCQHASCSGPVSNLMPLPSLPSRSHWDACASWRASRRCEVGNNSSLTCSAKNGSPSVVSFDMDRAGLFPRSFLYMLLFVSLQRRTWEALLQRSMLP